MLETCSMLGPLQRETPPYPPRATGGSGKVPGPSPPKSAWDIMKRILRGDKAFLNLITTCHSFDDVPTFEIRSETWPDLVNLVQLSVAAMRSPKPAMVPISVHSDHF